MPHINFLDDTQLVTNTIQVNSIDWDNLEVKTEYDLGDPSGLPERFQKNSKKLKGLILTKQSFRDFEESAVYYLQYKLNPQWKEIKAILDIDENIVLSGSYLLSLLDRESFKPNDVDLYFLTQNAFKTALKYLLEKGYTPRLGTKFHDLETFLKSKTRFLYMDAPNKDLLPVQLIKIGWFYEMSRIVASFDISVVQFALNKTKFEYISNSLLDLQFKRMHLINLEASSQQLRRIERYLNRGFKLSYGELRKIAELEIPKYDDSDFKAGYYENEPVKSQVKEENKTVITNASFSKDILAKMNNEYETQEIPF